MKITGYVVMLIGLGLTIFTTITFFTREKVVDLGVVEITKNQPHNLNWSPFVGIAVLVIGAFLIILTRKKS
ncbi:MAG TPA: hypothetical protein P5084_03860 [Paludibacter sp.]|nr:hypothetical protein [Paludibacter sp.]